MSFATIRNHSLASTFLFLIISPATSLAQNTVPVRAVSSAGARIVASTAAEPSISSRRVTSTSTETSEPAQRTTAKTTDQLPMPRRSPVRSQVRSKNGRLPTYGDPAANDNPTLDDPVVRRAATDALGNLMGSIIVVDPETGRVLTIVNQRTAFEDGYQPCSAFKPAVALAALQ